MMKLIIKGGAEPAQGISYYVQTLVIYISKNFSH